MIPEVRVGTLLQRLRSLVDAHGKDALVVATDGDGTLWSSDVGEALFDLVLAEGLVGDAARVALLEEAQRAGLAVTESDDATRLARALWQAYVEGRYAEDAMCAAMSWCMAGMELDALVSIATEMLEGSFGLAERLHPEALDVLRFAAEAGVPTFIVSASPRAVVEPAARRTATVAGIPVPDVLAMTPRVNRGIIEPSTVGVWPYGEGKVTALREAIGPRRVLCALGDNVFDVPMLATALVPVAVRPKRALVAVAAQVPDLVVVV